MQRIAQAFETNQYASDDCAEVLREHDRHMVLVRAQCAHVQAQEPEEGGGGLF